jgi:hypothetical protein
MDNVHIANMFSVILPSFTSCYVYCLVSYYPLHRFSFLLRRLVLEKIVYFVWLGLD